MRVYVQFMGIRGTEKKNSLEAQDNLLRISANISMMHHKAQHTSVSHRSREPGARPQKHKKQGKEQQLGSEGGRQDGYQKKTELKRNLRG